MCVCLLTCTQTNMKGLGIDSALTSVGQATAFPGSHAKLLATRGANRAACMLFRSRAKARRLHGPAVAVPGSGLAQVTSSWVTQAGSSSLT
jgi:hypothetical protein